MAKKKTRTKKAKSKKKEASVAVQENTVEATKEVKEDKPKLYVDPNAHMNSNYLNVRADHTGNGSRRDPLFFAYKNGVGYVPVIEVFANYLTWDNDQATEEVDTDGVPTNSAAFEYAEIGEFDFNRTVFVQGKNYGESYFGTDV